MKNKGFAITSVIYGLAILGVMVVVILMGTLSSTRNNVSEEAKRVEEFLIAFNQTQVTYRAQGTYSYTVPNGESGWYRIEAFGPRSTQIDSSLTGDNKYPKGAYVTGIVYFNEGDKLTFTIGGYGGNTEVKVGSTLLVRAGGGSGLTPGGTTKCYSRMPTGGDINMDSYTLASGNLLGTEGLTFSNSCSNSSYLRGYPTASEGASGDYYLVDGLMLAGGNGGSDGKVILERLAERDDDITNIPRKNTHFNNVSTVTLSSAASVYYSYHDEFNSSSNNFTGHVGKCNSTTSCTIGHSIDDLVILIDGNEKVDVQNLVVTLKHSDSTGDYVVYNASNQANVSLNYGVTMRPTGLHFSAYQPDHMTSDILGSSNSFALHGNYYLIPVVSENMVISAVSNSDDDANQLKIEGLTGESRQRWSIDLINSPGATTIDFPNIPNVSGRNEYRIVELTRYKALNIYYDENYKMNFISASETFNSLSRNEPQIWNIYPLNDGTYAIKTAVPSFSIFEKSGFLFAKTKGGINNINDVMIGLTIDPNNTAISDKQTVPTNIERFYLYSLDFSK